MPAVCKATNSVLGSMKVSTPWAWALLAERDSRTTLHPGPSCPPAPTCALRWSEYPLTASLSRRATGKRPRPWRRTTQQVAATSDLAPSGGPVSTRLSARNGDDSPARVPPPRGSQTKANATSPSPSARGRGLAHTYGVQRSLYSLAMVSMPPARATAT